MIILLLIISFYDNIFRNIFIIIYQMKRDQDFIERKKKLRVNIVKISIIDLHNINGQD